MRPLIKIVSIAAALLICTGVRTAVDCSAAETTPVVSFGKAAKRSGLSRIKSSLFYSDCDFTEIPVLKKSRTIKNCFVLDRRETLIIPDGKTLTLRGGADIDGDIYIEKGGKLVLDYFSVTLRGDIVCFGDLSVTGGTLYCADGSMIYVAEGGSFTAADDGGTAEEINARVETDLGANVVCFGECNITDPTFAAEPVAAVYCRWEYGGATKEVSPVENPDDILSIKYSTDTAFSDMDFADCYTVFFSGGGCILYVADGNISGGWSNIGNVNLEIANSALKDYHGK